MIVRLRRSPADCAGLIAGQSYWVIGIEADDYRLLTDLGHPYLFPAELFEVVDSTEPADWMVEKGDDGERYAYPAPLNAVGFFEDFFDQEPSATRVFWKVVNQRLALAAA